MGRQRTPLATFEACYVLREDVKGRADGRFEPKTYRFLLRWNYLEAANIMPKRQSKQGRSGLLNDLLGCCKKPWMNNAKAKRSGDQLYRRLKGRRHT